LAQRHPRLVLLLAAVVLLAPSLVLGTLITHSSHLNLTWATQFAEQVQAGIFYPRWLPDSFGGLGAPTFYFYPPLPFWIDALVSVVTFDTLPVSYRLSLTSVLLLWASGLAMHAWLERETQSRRTALWGALAYMIAPYHLLDHYLRGALAEFTTFAVLPLFVLAILLTAEKHRAGIGLLAVAFAALLMSHLPTALLVSVTVVPLYILFRAWRLADRRAAIGFLLRSALAGALGIGLAATYLLPAMLLQRWISADLFWTDYYRVENWFVVAPDRWPELSFMQIIASLAAAYGLATVALGLVVLRLGPDDGRRTELGFWLAISLVCLLLMSGLVPWFWQLPEVAKVQFPWRLMVIVEFAVITAFCLAPLKKPQRRVVYVLAAAAVALVPGIALIGGEAADRIGLTRSNPGPATIESTEYQPAGYPHSPPQGGHTNPRLDLLARVPTIDCTPAAQTCSAQADRFGALQVRVDGTEPTTVVLRRFYFPAWQVEMLPSRETIVVKPTDQLRLASFQAPAGRADFRLHRSALPIERWGWAVTGLSLAMLLAWAVLPRYTRRRSPIHRFS
jgi:hypothetical protein